MNESFGGSTPPFIDDPHAPSTQTQQHTPTPPQYTPHTTGACGGELACSTCHVVFDPALYAQLPGKTEEEEDMLDLAWGLTDTCVRWITDDNV